jgi:sec-independent protein translocase protein TatA
MVGLDNPLHLAFLLLIVLLVFGAKRLPEMGRSLGTGMRSFKESLSGEAAPERSGQLSSLGAEDGVAASGENVIEGVSNPVQERLAA